MKVGTRTSEQGNSRVTKLQATRALHDYAQHYLTTAEGWPINELRLTDLYDDLVSMGVLSAKIGPKGDTQYEPGPLNCDYTPFLCFVGALQPYFLAMVLFGEGLITAAEYNDSWEACEKDKEAAFYVVMKEICKKAYTRYCWSFSKTPTFSRVLDDEDSALVRETVGLNDESCHLAPPADWSYMRDGYFTSRWPAQDSDG